MRIALFADTYPPRINGVAVSVHTLHVNLVAMGHEVLVVTCTDPNVTGPEKNIIRIPSVPFRTERLATVAGPKFYLDIGRFNPDIIHTHAEFTLGILGRFISATMRRPHVHTMHTMWEYYTKHIIDIDVLEPAMRMAARRYTALICNQSDKVIVPTSKVKDLLRTYKVRKDIVVIPTGIDTDRFSSENVTKEQLREIRSSLGISENDKVLINICRVEKEKNLFQLLKWLQGYLLSRSDVKFVIIGDGTARKRLERQSAEMGLAGKVIFAGPRPREEINRYYRIGDVFVSASISETQGLTYTEAMASGLPVVAIKDRCLEGVLHDGENGFMFNDADGLVKAVDRLLSDDEQRLRLSKEAEASAQKLSAKAYAEKVTSLYEGLV